MSAGTSGLEAKLALIASSLEKGLSDGNKAVADMGTALTTSISGLDSGLSGLASEITAKLQAVAGRLSAQEFAKAFQSIVDAVGSHSGSTSQLLETILQVVNDMAN